MYHLVSDLNAHRGYQLLQPAHLLGQTIAVRSQRQRPLQLTMTVYKSLTFMNASLRSAVLGRRAT